MLNENIINFIRMDENTSDTDFELITKKLLNYLFNNDFKANAIKLVKTNSTSICDIFSKCENKENFLKLINKSIEFGYKDYNLYKFAAGLIYSSADLMCFAKDGKNKKYAINFYIEQGRIANIDVNSDEVNKLKNTMLANEKLNILFNNSTHTNYFKKAKAYLSDVLEALDSLGINKDNKVPNYEINSMAKVTAQTFNLYKILCSDINDAKNKEFLIFTFKNEENIRKFFNFGVERLEHYQLVLDGRRAYE